jgi:hypothetical protein
LSVGQVDIATKYSSLVHPKLIRGWRKWAIGHGGEQALRKHATCQLKCVFISFIVAQTLREADVVGGPCLRTAVTVISRPLTATKHKVTASSSIPTQGPCFQQGDDSLSKCDTEPLIMEGREGQSCVRLGNPEVCRLVIQVVHPSLQ